jgi:hypothetical protein
MRARISAIAGLVLLAGCTNGGSAPGPLPESATRTSASDELPGFIVGSESNDGITHIFRRPDHSLAAILTDGARTMTFIGDKRTFTERDTTRAKVTTDHWVRVAPQVWHPAALGETWFREYFRTTVDSTKADILATAMQYQDGAPMLRDDDGVPYAGDASFGLLREGDDVDGADFYDYLGIGWRFPDGTRKQSDPKWYRKLDCSGFLRLIYGYRSGIAISDQNDGTDGLPRTAQAMATNSQAVTIAAGDTDAQAPKTLEHLEPGDLVFFALRSDTHMSHSGIYIGDDQDGHLRFISSRTQINGPTFGDYRAKSILDTGVFRHRLRRVIRL